MSTGESTFSSFTAEQVEGIRAQLGALLASPQFRQSKRYPAFLQYVVESTLRGDDDELKERTIGVEVFGRLPHYDTSVDPTVRLTAAEVRKRLAQYYQQSEHANELQITLQPGSYVPAFSWTSSQNGEVESGPSPIEEATQPLDGGPEASPSASEPRRKVPFPLWIPIAVMIVLLISSIAAWLYKRPFGAQAIDDVWSPLMSDAKPITIVLPDLSKGDLLPEAQETPSTTVLAHIRNNRIVDFSDSAVLGQIAFMAGHWNRPYMVRLSSDTSFEDLQTGPAILIGAVDNPWTMRFLEPLPYTIVRRGDTLTFDIIGKKDHGPQPGWSVDMAQPYVRVQQDYGIIVREMDAMTGKPVLIIAGLGQNATAAGMRLLSDPALTRQIAAGAPKTWPGRNLEIVFSTRVIEDKFGPPLIVAREYW